MTRDLLLSLALDAVTAAAPRPEPVPRPEHRLIADLGFDSLRVSMLALELEDRLCRPVLLDPWLQDRGHPDALTVNSLATYLASVVPVELVEG